MRSIFALYAIGHRVSLALGLLVVVVSVSAATGTTSLPLPWLSEGSLDLSVDHLLAVALLAAHVTLLTGELSSREESSVRSWWWADCLGMAVLLCGPVFLAFTGDAGLLQNTLLYLVFFFFISLVIGPETAYPTVIFLIVVQTMVVALVPDRSLIPVFWDPDPRIIAALFLLATVAFLVARRPVKTSTRLRITA